jgi:hypothetical protein
MTTYSNGRVLFSASSRCGLGLGSHGEIISSSRVGSGVGGCTFKALEKAKGILCGSGEMSIESPP